MSGKHNQPRGTQDSSKSKGPDRLGAGGLGSKGPPFGAAPASSPKLPAAPVAPPKETQLPDGEDLSPTYSSFEARLMKALASTEGRRQFDSLRDSNKKYEEAKSRSRSLPLMFYRHGPAQVFIFLVAKGGTDKTLADLLHLLFVELGGNKSRYAFCFGDNKVSREQEMGKLGASVIDRLGDQHTFAQLARWVGRLLEAMGARQGGQDGEP
jgi:hypothetical protein